MPNLWQVKNYFKKISFVCDIITDNRKKKRYTKVTKKHKGGQYNVSYQY